MSYLLLNQTTSPGAPAAGKVSLYADTTALPTLRGITPAGLNLSLNPILNASAAAQTPAAATRTYIAGSALAVPTNKLQVGTCLRWRFSMTKTAAGLAASTFDICFGTAGTTADTARISFTKPAGTAVADEGLVQILCVVRTIGATGIASGEFMLVHNLSATGHATVPCVVVSTISAGFDMTVANLIAGVCITSGASDAITIQLVQAEMFYV